MFYLFYHNHILSIILYKRCQKYISNVIQSFHFISRRFSIEKKTINVKTCVDFSFCFWENFLIINSKIVENYNVLNKKQRNVIDFLIFDIRFFFLKKIFTNDKIKFHTNRKFFQFSFACFYLFYRWNSQISKHSKSSIKN